jgi:hypothetical protein
MEMEIKPGNRSYRLLGQHPWIFDRFKKDIRKKVGPWLQKGIPLRIICERLNKAHITTFRGRSWGVSTLSQALKEK